MARPGVRLLCWCALAATCRATVFVGHPPHCADTAAAGYAASTPLCSLAAAVARAALVVPVVVGRTVVLLGGTHHLDATLRLTVAHSGLTIRANGRERVTLSGGAPVTGWRRSGTDPRVWLAQLPPALMGATPRQLYVNGVRAARASGNASELLGNLTMLPTPNTPQNPQTGGLPGYFAANATLKGWWRVQDAEFVYTAMAQPWIASRCRIRAVSADGHTLTMERCLNAIGPGRPAAAAVDGGRWWNSNLPATIENALELLSEPGTFYVDSTSGQVSYIPRQGEDLTVASVVAPVLESLITANGTANLTLSGLDFAHTSWLGAAGPCGYVPQQAGMRRGTGYCTAYADNDFVADPTASHGAVKMMPKPWVLGVGGVQRIISPVAGGGSGTAALVSQSRAARMTLAADGSLCVWVQFASESGTAHEPLGYCLTTGVDTTSTDGVVRLSGSAAPDSTTKQCAASHCAAAACLPCCGQPGGAAGPEYTCPATAPLCTGYVANKTFGQCGPGPIQCAADHGHTRPCCGQPGGGVGPAYQCPADKPKCMGYVLNHGWGRCEKLGTAGFVAMVVNGSVCVVDRGTNLSTYCSPSPASGATRSDLLGPHFLMLSDDGAVCVHSGAFDESSVQATSAAVWCLPGAWAHPLMGEGENHVARIPGGVTLAAVTHAAVTDCSFRHMGGSGLDLYGGVQHSAVRGCFVSDISGTGVQVGSTSPCPHCPSCGGCRGAPCRLPPGAAVGAAVSTGLDMSPPCPPIGDGDGPPFKRPDLNITLEDNVVADVAVEYSGCVGVWGGVTVQLRFRHNEICRVPYSGLSVGWNWAIPAGNTVQQGQEISYNRISYWLQSRLADGGATYMLGPQPNSTHHDNYIHDGGSGTEPGGSGHGSGVYPDDGSAYWDISSNVARNLSGGSWLFAWNDEDEFYLTVHDNWADTNTSRLACAVSQRPTPTCRWWNNTIVETAAGELWPVDARHIMAGAGLRPGRGHADGVHACPMSEPVHH